MLNVFATCTDHETNQLGYSVLNGAIAWSTRKVEGEDGVVRMERMTTKEDKRNEDKSRGKWGE